MYHHPLVDGRWLGTWPPCAEDRGVKKFSKIFLGLSGGDLECQTHKTTQTMKPWST